jgi:hypothetical protein
MYPSDSVYFGHIADKCGSVKAGLKSFARFSAERELYSVWKDQIVLDRHIHFVDLPDSCEWFH